jgi:hypothetical protein
MPTPERLKTLKAVNEALTPIVNSANPNVRLAQWLQISVLNQLVQISKEVKDKEGEKTYREQLTAAINRFFNEGGEDLNIRLLRAEMLIEAGQKQKALDDLEIAAGMVVRPERVPVPVRHSRAVREGGTQRPRAADPQTRHRHAERDSAPPARARGDDPPPAGSELRKQQEAERKKQQEAQKQPQSNQQPAANAPQGDNSQGQAAPQQGK